MKNVTVTGALENFIEEGQFIIDSDNLFCVRSTCEGCRYEKYCTVIEDNDFLEYDYKKSTRNNIRFGRIEPKEWVAVFPSLEAFTHLETDENNTVYTSDPSSLPESVKKEVFLGQNGKIVYKRVNLEEVFGDDYVVYEADEDSYYCVKKCDGCTYRDRCKPELVEKPSFKVYVAIDSASQEPQIITFLSEEPKYIEIFKNNSLYDIDYLLEPLEWILEDVLGVDPKSHSGASFIDWVGFEDKTFLYRLGSEMYSQIGNPDDKTLTKTVKKVVEKWEEFLKVTENR